MPDPRWRKVLRDVWLHKSRTSLVVVAISVGIVGAGSVLNTWSLLRAVTRAEFDSSNPASAVIRTDSIDESLLAQVRSIESVALAEARRTIAGSVLTSSGWKTAVLMSTGDFRSSRIGTIKHESGDWPPSANSIVIESSSVDFSGATVGGRFTVQVGDGEPRELRVTGIARDVGLAPGWMEHVVYAFVTPGTLAALGAPPTLNSMRIVVADRNLSRDQIRRVAAEISAVIESSGRRVHDIDVPVPGRHIHAAQMDSLLFTQGAFGALALLLSAFLVVNLVTAMLAGQLREIGIMKTLGARPGQIAGMYLVLALGLGLVASVIAIPAALVIGRLYAQFSAELLNFDISGASIPAWVLMTQLAVGLILPVLASAIPVVRGSRIPVSEALRDFGIAGNGGSAGALLRRAPGISRPVILSLRNAFRKRQRMILTLTTLATGGAVYLGAINLRASVVASVDTLFGTQRFDMAVRLASPHDADSILQIARTVGGVGNAEVWAGAQAVPEDASGVMGSTFGITAPPGGTTMLSVPVVRGRWIRAGDTNALVVNKRLVEDQPGIDVGRTVMLTIAGRQSSWEIVGVVDAGPAPAAYAAREALAHQTGALGATTAIVESVLDGPASQLDLVQRVRTAMTDAGLEVQSTQLMVEQRRVVEDHLLMVAGFLGIMGQLMIVVGGLGLASTMSLSVLERTREIGVMRAIGARHRTIFSIVQVEGLVVALLSWLIAIPLSIPMSFILGKAFGRIMFTVPVTYLPNPTGAMSWLAVVVGVSIAACAWPAWRAMRVPTAAALAYE